MNCSPNIITANFSGGRHKAKTAWRHQWDHGQVLCVTGIDDLPLTFTAHFSVHKEYGAAQPVEGIDGQVEIPDIWLTFGKQVYCWIYITDGESGETVYTITIPVIPRPMPEYYEMEDTGVFDAVVAEVSEYAESANDAATRAAASAEAAATSADNAAESASAAETAKTAAETAQGKAEDAQADAETAKGAAEAAQTAAENAKTAAVAARRAAETAAEDAQTASSAAYSASTFASTSASEAQDYASRASLAESNAMAYSSSASSSANIADNRATAATNAATTATAQAEAAEAAKTTAVEAKTAAQSAQSAAETAASEASQSATAAAGSATAAAGSATAAAGSASNAAASETAAEAAATRAETAAATLTVDDALSDTSENPVQNKVITGEVTQLKSAIDALKIVDTASGAIASFPDGAAMPMKSLTVEVSPIQDLHGQDAPYPAGGGKNKFDENGAYEAGKFIDANGNVRTSTTTPVQNLYAQKISVTAGAAYTASGKSTTASVIRIIQYKLDDTFIGRALSESAVNPSVTFTADAEAAYIIVNPDVTITEIQFESGDTVTAFQPYSNICPISGRESVTVTRTGVNLWGGDRWYDSGTGTADLENRTVSGVYTASLPIIRFKMFKPNTAYTLILTMQSTATHGFAGYSFEYSDGTTTTLKNTAINSTKGTYAWTSNASKTLTGITRASYSGTKTFFVDESGIFEGNLTAADFEPYNGDSTTIQLGSTVYGGTVDVTTGKLTVTNVSVDMGTLNWRYLSASEWNCFYVTFSDKKKGASNFLCSTYPISQIYNTANDKVAYGHSNNSNIYIRDTAYSDTASFKAAMSGQTLCYQLATPLEITLDPATLTTLKGQNNVWSDADSVSVDYVCDPKLYIARLTEPDADMVADANITSGSYFMVGNTLYLATANIASGATIVPGVNCTKTNLASALNAINS